MRLSLNEATTSFGVEALGSVCLTFLLCTLVVLSVTLCSDVDKRRAASRDCAFFILHGVSTFFSLEVVFENFSRYEKNERHICYFMALLVDTTWVVVRISVFNIYRVRLNDLIQKNIFYPTVRWVCWSAMLVGTIPLFTAAIVKAEIGDQGSCEHTPRRGMLQLAAFTQVISCLIYIVLFTIPFFKYPIGGAWKGPEGFHLAVVIFDALIDIGTMVIVFFAKSRRQCVVIYLANVILSNVLLVFIFSDWQLRLLPCKNRRITEVPEGRSLLTSMDFQDRYPAIKIDWEIGVRVSDFIER